jgi:predicted AAA+ superfamily ATPase
MIPRTLAGLTQKMASWFPVVSVTGPRQSGKSTLVRSIFPDYDYLNLEDPQIRRAAADDPVGFIRNRGDHLILDEAQYVPDLFSMIQVVSDERSTNGQYILSGSQNFLMLKSIHQSLAGRVGLLRLLPLSFAEAQNADSSPSVEEFMFRGGFPRLYDEDMPEQIFFSSYLDTYLHRDVEGSLDVRRLTDFERVVRLCALSAGNLVNYSHLAKDAGVDYRTIKDWISILEASYVLFELPPFFSNKVKTLIKTPKLYFYDSGLLCYLLGIRTKEDLLTSPLLGQVFENLIVSETAKMYLNQGQTPPLSFYRDKQGTEVDLVEQVDSSHLRLIEIKSGQTYHNRFAQHLSSVGERFDVAADGRYVVSRVESSFTTPVARVETAADWLTGKSVRRTA